MKTRCFTLVELIAVVVIITIGVGIATVSIRSDREATGFEQASREFAAFAGRARTQAMELGRDRVIIYDAAERIFRAADPEVIERDENEMILVEPPLSMRQYEQQEGLYEPEQFAQLKWKLPENYEFSTDETFSGYSDQLEIFRFYADGGGAGVRKFVLESRNQKRIFEISPLTGLMTEAEEKKW